MTNQTNQKIEVFDIDNVMTGMKVSQDIKDRNGLLLVGANTELNPRLIEKLRQLGITRIPIFVSKPSNSITVNDLDLNEVLRQHVLINVSSAVNKYVKNDSFKERITSFIFDFTKEDFFMTLMIDIKTIGYNVFPHSLNVFVLSVLIGLKNHFPIDRLLILAQAALLHDIGKKFVPEEILGKSDNLSQEEQKVLQQHPHFGFEYLQSLDKLPYEVSKLIQQHHERLDGSGYPNGLKGQDIHRLAQIISIADSFDQIVGAQDLQNRYIVTEAIEFLQGSGGIFFDYDLVTCLLDEVGVYHVHDWVTLSNGDIGVISHLNDGTPLRPVVTVFFDRFKQRYTHPKIIDLTSKNFMSLFIRNILD